MMKNSIVDTLYYSLLITILQTIRLFNVELEKPIFIISNIVFTVFVILKILLLRNEKYALLNPLLLASIKMFLLSYGATIFYIFIGNKPLNSYIEVHNPYGYLNNGMIYASIGFITMWFSYHGSTARKIATSIVNYLTLCRNIIRRELQPRWFIIYSTFIISIVFKLLIVSLGVYGVLGTIFMKSTTPPFLNYIVTLSSASSGILLILYLNYFETGNNKWIFFSFFILDLFFSIITGFKGTILMSILMVPIAYYLVNQRLRSLYIIVAFLSLLYSYKIVEPYRNLLRSKSKFELNSINNITKGIIDSYRSENFVEKNPDKLKIIKRFNFLPELTKFQEYKIEHGLKHYDPDFLYLTLTAPVQAFIPRFLWENKPKSDLGLRWVTQKVFRRNYNSSTAFGPLGFLYLTGGAVAIIIGFFIVGVFLRLINQFLISGYWGGIFVALALTFNAVALEAQFNFYVISFIQTLILVLLFQFFLFKKSFDNP